MAQNTFTAFCAAYLFLLEVPYEIFTMGWASV